MTCDKHPEGAPLVYFFQGFWCLWVLEILFDIVWSLWDILGCVRMVFCRTGRVVNCKQTERIQRCMVIQYDTVCMIHI